MLLIERIKADFLTARKNQNTKMIGAYQSLLSSMDQSRIDTTNDSLVQKAIEKEVKRYKSSNDTMSNMKNGASDIDKGKLSCEITKNKFAISNLESYLPTYLSSEEIKNMIKSQISPDMNLGDARKVAVEALGDTNYEMKTVIEVIKTILN